MNDFEDNRVEDYNLNLLRMHSAFINLNTLLENCKETQSFYEKPKSIVL